MINAKGFKLTIYILLAILVVGCFCVLFIEKTTNFDKINNVSSDYYSDNYYNGTYGINSNFYKNVYSQSTIAIRYQSEFNNLVGAANFTYQYTYKEAYAEHTVTRYLYDFVGKKVVLNGNFSTTEKIFEEFRGEFDGNGNTISFPNSQLSTSGSGEYGAFCRYNYGTIKNTRFKNISIYIKALTTDFNGGIVGENTGTIENCIVENFSCKSNRDDGDLVVRCGPLAGYNSGTIKNCMVNGTYRIGGEDDGGIQEGVWAAYFVARNAGASNSIFTANVVKDWLTEDTHVPSEWDSAELSDDFSSCSSAYNSMTSDISTTCGESGTAWFKYKTLSHGYGDSPYYNSGGTIYYYNVYLRAFVDFTTYYFNSADTSMGTVTTSSITVPNDYAGISASGQTQTATYGGSCRANPKAAYSFSHWTNSGTSYTAHFTGKISKIYFSNYDKNIIIETTNVAIDTWYNLAYGANLKITYIYCEKKEQQYTYEEYEWNGYYEELVEKIGTAYCLKALTFEFTDAGGIYRKIIYKPKNNTQCIGVPKTGFKAFMGTITYNEGNNPFNVYNNELFEDPMLLNKEYNITFG